MSKECFDPTKDVYYGPLIDSYIKAIFESGLLLDEDLEVLLASYNFRSFPEFKRSTISYAFMGGIGSILGSILFARRYHSAILIIPSMLLTTFVSVSKFRSRRREQFHINLMANLINVIRKLHSLNINILRYMKTRSDLGKAQQQDTFVVLFNKSTEEFFQLFSRSVFNLHQFIMDNLNKIARFSAYLTEDYESIKQFNPINFIKESNVGDIEDCVAFTSKIQDVHVLWTSKLLSYLGIVFTSRSSQLNREELEHLLNDRLPHLMKYLEHHTNYLNKQFSGLRRAFSNPVDNKVASERPVGKNIPSKLQGDFVYAVNNLSVIQEKSQLLLERIEDDDFNISLALCDLKNHTLAVYESLDLLCKLYGILSNPKNDPREIHDVAAIPKCQRDPVSVVSYDDVNEPAEEQFELYLPEENDTKDSSPGTYQEDSGIYLSLMLHELKHSLKRHQRFVEARKRRGSEDEEPESEEVNIKPLPKFDLTVIGPERKGEENEHRTVRFSLPTEEHEALQPTEPVSMPPPPPMPSFNIDNLEPECPLVNRRSMLENIKALSTQIEAKEEVFGSSGSDSD